MDRVVLGKKVEQSFSTSIISYTPSEASAAAGGLGEGFSATVVFNETDLSKFPLYSTIKFPPVKEGEESQSRQINSSASIIFIFFYLKKEYI